MWYTSISSIDRTLWGATIPGQKEHGSDANEKVLLVLKRSGITEASPSDCLLSYSEHSLVQSVYSTTTGDWTSYMYEVLINNGLPTYIPYIK